MALDKTTIFMYLPSLRSFHPNPQPEKTMKYNWPVTPHRHVAVFVDFMNVYMTRKNIFQGLFTIETILNQVQALAKTVGEQPQIAIYLNAAVFRNHNYQDWTELLFCAASIGAHIIHVPDFNEVDDVDAVMIEDMLELNKFPDQTLPFMLVTGDTDFTPTIERISDDRPILLGLPCFPKGSKLGQTTGFRCLDPMYTRHKAFWDLLSPESSTTPSYIENWSRHSLQYAQTCRLVEQLIRLLPSVPASTNFNRLIVLLERQLEPIGLGSHENAIYCVRALEYYQVITVSDGFHLRTEHPVFDRQTFPAAS